LLCPPRKRQRPWVCDWCRSHNAVAQESDGLGRRAYADQKLRRERPLIKPRTLQPLAKNAAIGSRKISSHSSQYDQYGQEPDNAGNVVEVSALEHEAADAAFWEHMNEENDNSVNGDSAHIETEGVHEDASDLDDLGANIATQTRVNDASDPSPIDHACMRAEMEQALLEQHPDRMLRVLQRAVANPEYLESIPNTTFSEILQLLRPENLLGEMVEIHQDLSDAFVTRNGIKTLRTIVYEYTEIILDLITKRRDTGRSLALADYEALLDVARATGSSSVVRVIWRALQNDQLEPDLACYNQYLGSMVSNDKLAEHRHTTRVTEMNMTQRIKPRPLGRYNNYRLMDGGIKQEVMSFFTVMLKNGIVANEESYCYAINALAREGDVKGFERILHQVWGINTWAVSRYTGAGEEPQPGVAVKPGTSLYPTNELLWTVAHAYSINNDVPGALRVVDYLMRQYNIKADVHVWEELFRWTFVMAAHRGTNHGGRLLPKESVSNLWNTMTQAPYRVKPTMRMYNSMVKILALGGRTDDMLVRMEEGLQLALQNRKKCARAYSKLGRANSGLKAVLERKFDEASLERLRDTNLLRRWLGLAHWSMAQRSRVDSKGDWSLQIFPKLMLDPRWAPFLTSKVAYESNAGLIELQIRDPDTILADAIKKWQGKEVIDNIMRDSQRVLGIGWTRSQEPHITKRLRQFWRDNDD